MKKGLFTEEIDNFIKEHMKQWRYLPKPYVKISNEIPKYSSKQIRQRWISKLDPRLCHDPLNEEEKKFIIEWVETNQSSTGVIHWKDLIKEVEHNFGKLRSENTLKNFWNQRERSLKRISHNHYEHENRIFLESEVSY